MLTTISANSQNRYTQVVPTTYTPLSYEELSYVANQKRSQYNQNQNYLYSLKENIRGYNSQIRVEEFNIRLQYFYDKLVEIEDEDLARYSNYLRQIEDAVKEVVNDYNNYVSGRSYENSYETNMILSNHFMIKALEATKANNDLEAINNYTKYLNIVPNDTDALYFRGLAKKSYGDHQGAIDDYSRIIELYPNYPTKYISLAKLYLLRGLFRYGEGETMDDVCEDFKKAQALGIDEDYKSLLDQAINLCK